MSESNTCQVDSEPEFVDPVQLRQLAATANPYYRLERRPGRAELYPTERLYQEHLAVSLTGAILFALFIGVCLVVVVPGLITLGIAGLLTIVVACRAASVSSARKDNCGRPLIVSDDGAITYRDEVVCPPGRVDFLQVRYSASAEHPEYQVVAVIKGGEVKRLTWPHFGGLSDG